MFNKNIEYSHLNLVLTHITYLYLVENFKSCLGSMKAYAGNICPVFDNLIPTRDKWFQSFRCCIAIDKA